MDLDEGWGFLPPSTPFPRHGWELGAVSWGRGHWWSLADEKGQEGLSGTVSLQMPQPCSGSSVLLVSSSGKVAAPPFPGMGLSHLEAHIISPGVPHAAELLQSPARSFSAHQVRRH